MKHPFYKKFSFPFNVHKILDMYKKDNSLLWFKKHSEIINEVYCSPTIFNFKYEDMNGNAVFLKKDELDTIKKILTLLKSYNIKISIIFNNIFNDGKLNENEIEKIINLKKYIDIVVIGNEDNYEQLNKHFFIKNTVIHNVNISNINRYLKYDQIYVHDDITQNIEKYKNWKAKYKKEIGTVVNFDYCYSGCNLKKKHYLDIKNNVDINTRINYCPVQKMSTLERLLKISMIPPLYSQFIKYVDIIDCFKLQGRNDESVNFDQAINIIELIFNKKKSLKFDEITFPMYKRLNVLPYNTVKNWLIKKENCGGICDKCNYCNNIINMYGDLNEQNKII